MSTFAPMGGLGGISGGPALPGDGGLKDVLFNMFKGRQGGFEGVPGTGTELPAFPNQTPDAGLLPGGGLAYGFIDPNWFKDVIPEVPVVQQQNTMAQVLTAVNQGRGGRRGEVHGGPGGENPVVKWDPNDPLGDLHAPPKPPPLSPNGHWRWDKRGGGTGDPGVWVWEGGAVDPSRGGRGR